LKGIIVAELLSHWIKRHSGSSIWHELIRFGGLPTTKCSHLL